MTKDIRPIPNPMANLSGLLKEASSFRQDPQFSKGGKGTPTKDPRDYARDGRQTASQQKGSDAALSQRSAFFEQKLFQAEKDQGFQSRDDEDGSGEEAVQVLFETAQPGRQGGAVAQAAQTARSETSARVDEIFKQITMRVDAAIRPGPAVASGPVSMNIPLNVSESGLTGIQVSLSDTAVTVKLCFPAAPTPGDASQQLLAAASQLGQLLQAHLPGRRIRIEQSTPTIEEAQKDDTPGTEPVDLAFGLPRRDGRR